MDFLKRDARAVTFNILRSMQRKIATALPVTSTATLAKSRYAHFEGKWISKTKTGVSQCLQTALFQQPHVGNDSAKNAAHGTSLSNDPVLYTQNSVLWTLPCSDPSLLPLIAILCLSYHHFCSIESTEREVGQSIKRSDRFQTLRFPASGVGHDAAQRALH